MSEKKVAKRIRIKPFVKTLNYSHIMPTRYSVDFDLKKTVDAEVTPDNREAVLKSLTSLFEDKYKTQNAKSDKKAAGAQYFFTKLRF